MKHLIPLIVLALAAPALAQMSTAEAMARLQQREAERQRIAATRPAATQPVARLRPTPAAKPASTTPHLRDDAPAQVRWVWKQGLAQKPGNIDSYVRAVKMAEQDLKKVKKEKAPYLRHVRPGHETREQIQAQAQVDDRAKTLANYKHELEEARQPDWVLLPWIADTTKGGRGDMAVGNIGMVYGLRVEQILGPRRMLATVRLPQWSFGPSGSGGGRFGGGPANYQEGISDYRSPVMIEGMDTGGLTDSYWDKEIRNFEVTGTTTYITPLGTTNTVFILKPFNIHDWLVDEDQ